MGYTVKKLAMMSGVSVRTLHYYDEIGLLKPAHRKTNGYRLYEEADLLRLQQILFHRKLGFELDQIQSILGKRGFDRVKALEAHKRVLLEKMSETGKLIETIERTIRHLKGTRSMKSREMFKGFNAKEQAGHEKALVARFGKDVGNSIRESKRRIQNWTEEDWTAAGIEFEGICRELANVMDRGLSVGSAEAQKLVRRHYGWLSRFWTPNRKSYCGHSHLITDSELRKPYEAHHPGLPGFLAQAIRVFAEKELA